MHLLELQSVQHSGSFKLHVCSFSPAYRPDAQEAVALAIRAALHQETRDMAAAATNTEAGEITLQSLQLYHRKDGTPYMLGAGSFGMVGVLGYSECLRCCLLCRCMPSRARSAKFGMRGMRPPRARDAPVALLETRSLDSQVFKAKLHGKEEVAVKVFKLSARIKSEVTLTLHAAEFGTQLR